MALPRLVKTRVEDRVAGHLFASLPWCPKYTEVGVDILRQTAAFDQCGRIYTKGD